METAPPHSSLQDIVTLLGADSAAIMAPSIAERYLYCQDSFNMPQAWTDIKNPFDEDVTGGNVEVYLTGKPAVSNHLQKMIAGYYIESVMVVPISREGNVVATLELIHDKNGKIFSDEDLGRAEAFADKLDI